MWNVIRQRSIDRDIENAMDVATSPTDSQKSSSTMLFCCMCQSIYKEPKILPCLHSFCRHCLESAVTDGSDGSIIVCAICSNKSILPTNGLTGVLDNYFLDRMCQEHLMQVQDQLVARSLHSATTTGNFSEFTRPISRVSSELPRSRYTQLSNSTSQDKDQEDTQLANEGSLPEGDAGQASGQSTASAVAAIRNMSRLQNKVMSLQGEALRVTYAIDQVNQCTSDWQQNKEEIKKAVQRRSAQFQFFIQRMEHQLISQIDGKHTNDIFYTETNKSKADLRKNLNNILHEVNVLKSIQEFGKDAEINALSACLLGKSVGLTDVVLKKLHFDIDTPAKSIEELVTTDFGEIRLSTEESNIFAPEVLDFNEIPVENMTESVVGKDVSHFYKEGREESFEEDKKLDSIAINKSSLRRSVDRRSRRYNTDLGLNKEDVKEYLAQFQNARETFRTRRREILARGQQVREDTSPLRDETQKRPRSPSMMGRVQSLDRVAMPVALRERISARRSSDVQETKTLKVAEPERLSQNLENRISYSQHGSVFTFPHGHGGKHFVSGLVPPSPVIEEVPSPTSPQRILVKQTSYPYDMQPSSVENQSPQVSPSSASHSLVEQLRSTRSSNPSSSLFMGRRHSDQYTPLSPDEHTALNLLKHDSTSSRPVRRAISSAADRRAKMEFLRENWQKRKEILIQNEGFVSTDVADKHVAKPPAQNQPPVVLQSALDNAIVTVDIMETKSSLTSTSDPSGHPKLETMHQIRGRVAQYRNELTKVDDTRQNEENNMSPYTSIQVSKQLNSTLEGQIESTGSPVISPVTTTAQTIAQTPYRSRFAKLDEKHNKEVKNMSPYSNTKMDEKHEEVKSESPYSSITMDETHKEVKSMSPYSNTKMDEKHEEVKSESPYSSITMDETHKEVKSISPYSSPKTDESRQSEVKHNMPSYTSIQDYKQASYNLQTQKDTTGTSLISPRTTTFQNVPQTSGYKVAPITTTTTTRISKEATVTTSPVQPKPTPIDVVTTTSSSRYSRLLKPVETVDIASLISAMYSGKEKSILHDIKPASDTPSKPIVTEQVTNNTSTSTTINTIRTSSIGTTESITSNSGTLAPTNVITATSYKYRTENQRDLTTPKQISETNGYDESNKSLQQSQLNNDSTKATLQSQLSNDSPSKTSVQSLLNNDNPSKTSVQSELTNDSPIESAVQGDFNNDSSSELTLQTQRRQNRSGMRSRFTDGVSRRHTIEIGKSDIQSALQMISKENTTPVHQTTLHPIIESPSVNRTPLYTPYFSRFTDSSSRMLESDDPTDSDGIKDVTIAYKIRASGVTTKIIPSSLEIIEEKSLPEQSLAPESTAVKSRTPPSPTSPNAAETAQKAKLREIARKKKERWRHLTIT